MNVTDRRIAHKSQVIVKDIRTGSVHFLHDADVSLVLRRMVQHLPVLHGLHDLPVVVPLFPKLLLLPASPQLPWVLCVAPVSIDDLQPTM